MKTRLDQFIKSEGLSSGRLADIIGVQPSSISHLLAGRNKPGFDFICKILEKFPRLNPDWFILGVGNMYRDAHDDFKNEEYSNANAVRHQVVHEVAAPVKPTTQGLFSAGLPFQTASDDINSPDDSSIYSKSNESTEELKNLQVASIDQLRNDAKSQENPVSTSENRCAHNSIERIVIFFSNGTFKEYLSK